MKFSPKVFKLGKLRVVLVKEDRQSVTVRAMLGTGSREENDKEAGSAHFLEHFVFKGTRKFPKMYDVNEAVEKVGGAFNAYTGQNEMGFWVKMDKSNLELAVTIIGQLLTEPVLPAEHFDKERGTILEELYMYEDRPDSKAAEILTETMHGKTPMGRPIIGTVKSLKEMTVEELRAYFEKWFIADNIVVGVVGDYGKEEDVLAMIKREFEKLVVDKRKLPKKDVFAWGEQSKPRTALVSKKLDQAAIYMGYRALPRDHKLRYALLVTNQILGGGWMSRLLREVREERGWAYSIGSGIDRYEDVGNLYIGAGLPKGKLNEAVELIAEICYGLGGNNQWKIADSEIEEAKKTYRGRLALQMDKPETVLGMALEDLIFEGEIRTPDQILEKVNKVTLPEVREVCDLVFKPENLSVAVVGDYKKLDFKI